MTVIANGRERCEIDLLRRLIGCPTEVDFVERKCNITPATFKIKDLGNAFDVIVNTYDEHRKRPTRRQVIEALKDVTDPNLFDCLMLDVPECTADDVGQAVTDLRRYDKNVRPPKQSSDPVWKPRLTMMNDVEEKPVSWLWNDVIPSGMLSLLAGLQGIGKSFTTVDIAARISSGRPMPDGSRCEEGNVIFMAAEDDTERVLKPRLTKHGANHNRIAHLTGQYMDGHEHDVFVTLADLPVIEEALRIMTPRMLVIDPIGSYTGGKVNSFVDNEVRGILAPLQALAERYDCAIVFVAHHGKKEKVRCADDLILGSRAFSALSRVTRHIFKDESGRRLFLPGKNNLAVDTQAMAWSFALDSEPSRPPRIDWELATFHQTADDYVAQLQQSKKPDRGETAVDRAYAFLIDYLEGAEVLKEQILADADQAGHSTRSIERASKELLEAGRLKRGRQSGKHSKITWRLEDEF